MSCTKMRVVKHAYRCVLEAKRVVVVDPKIKLAHQYSYIVNDSLAKYSCHVRHYYFVGI